MLFGLQSPRWALPPTIPLPAAPPHMKRSLALLITGVLCTACATDGSKLDDHWSLRSVPGRVQRTLTSYDASRDGSVGDWMGNEFDATVLTIERHLFGYNPKNPLR